MSPILRILLWLICALPASSFAGTDSLIVPISRVRFHDRIKEEQLRNDKADGKLDGLVKVCGDEDINLQVTDALTRRVKSMLEWIETSPKVATNNEKIRHLNYVEDMLKSFRTGWKDGTFNARLAPVLVENFEQVMQVNVDSMDMSSLFMQVPYEVGAINSRIFFRNPGYREAQKILFLKFVSADPGRILPNLKDYVEESFADSLIHEAAKFSPKMLYDYALAKQSAVGKRIHQSSDPLTKTIAELTQTPNALFFFPFIDNIMQQRVSIDSIRKLIGDGVNGYDSVGYYKLLVRTEIEYYDRLVRQDTPYAMLGANGLRDMLKRKAIQHFVTPINDLHDQSNLNIRMRAIDPLTPEDLYFMLVMGENDIYTSSYKHSFSRLLQRMGTKPRGDQLLMSVNLSYFKKFIKMAANFNQLDTFLRTMSPQHAATLMRAFVANLDKTGNLEDAVDVADSYSSITDKKLLETIFTHVVENEDRSIDERNKRGEVIYSLLREIFRSADNNNIDLTESLGIPSIYQVEPKQLVDDSGRVVHQVFFYGDEDGKGIFQPFLNSFPGNDWRIKMEKEWVEIRSLKGKPVVVYANRPLDSDKNLDDSAQAHLNQYLAQQGIYPTVVTHRGHSYWLPGTIKRMPSSAKVIVLGSCGGYKNLAEILNVSPEAHIISTKEIGKGDINRPILNYLHTTFQQGQPIVWKDMWASLTRIFKADPNKGVGESWNDYIPPYRNLGAIFLKAYNRRMERE